MNNIKLWQHALVVLFGLGLCGAVQAQDWKATGEFGWFGVGKAQEGVTQVNWKDGTSTGYSIWNR